MVRIMRTDYGPIKIGQLRALRCLSSLAVTTLAVVTTS